MPALATPPLDLRAIHNTRLELCRRYSAAFCEYALEDEATGKPVIHAPVHNEWHHLLSKHRYLILWGSVEIGKSMSVSVGYTAWMIGKNPRIRVALLSNTEKQAMKIMNGLKKVLLSKRYREVFPHVRPAEIWNATTVTVAGWDGRNPTVQAFGLHGAVLGSRVDLLVIDDPLDFENTRTENGRNDTYDWYMETMTGRLTKNAQVVMTANAWHPDDMLHRLAKKPAYYCKRYPIWSKDPKTGEMVSIWPQQWPIERILDRKSTIDSLSFNRQFECIAHDDRTYCFQEEWIIKAEKLGTGLSWCYRLGAVPNREILEYGKFAGIFAGVDLATGRKRKKASDETVITVVGVRKNGNRRPLYIESGKWHGPDIIRRMDDVYARFGCVFWVETNAAQIYIVQFAEETKSAITVQAFETTQYNKFDPSFGVESLGVEFNNNRWEVPGGCPACQFLVRDKNGGVLPPREDCRICGGQATQEFEEWTKLRAEILHYSPTEHSGDRLMSLWIAREGARVGLQEPTVLPALPNRR